ncbi:hypothetical protein [Sorangium cellulosum]|uniref:hypothetical protein n=1 Tax=Sorangium cellulosum TaxID=56 RepID=UPI0012DB06A5|nr:hypothetical protein [Sorangium cellulosum]
MADVRQERVIKDAQRSMRAPRLRPQRTSVRMPSRSSSRKSASTAASDSRATAEKSPVENLPPAVEGTIRQLQETFAYLGRVLGIEMTQVNQPDAQSRERASHGAVGLREEVTSLRARVEKLEREARLRDSQGEERMPEGNMPREFEVRNKIVLPVDQWNRFVDFINAPAEPTESLRRLFDEED